MSMKIEEWKIGRVEEWKNGRMEELSLSRIILHILPHHPLYYNLQNRTIIKYYSILTLKLLTVLICQRTPLD